MNLVFHSSIPFSLKPLQGSTLSQTAQGSRVIWVIASIAIAVFAVSVALFRVYLVSSSNISKKNNWTSINDTDKKRDLTSHPLHKQTQNIPSNSLDYFDPFDTSFKGNGIKDTTLGLPVDPPSTSLQNNASHLNVSDDDSFKLGMHIIDLQDQIEADNQLLGIYTQDDEVKEIKDRIQELQSKLDKATIRYKQEMAKENYQTNGGGTNTSQPVDPTGIVSPSDTQNNVDFGSGTNLITHPVIGSNPSFGGQSNPLIPQDDSTPTMGNNTVPSNVPVDDPSDLNSKSDLGLYIIGLDGDIQMEKDMLLVLTDPKDVDDTNLRIQALEDDRKKALEKYKRAESRLDFQPKPIDIKFTDQSQYDVKLTELLSNLEKALPDNKYSSKASNAISDISNFIDLISKDEQLMTLCFTRIDEILFSKIFSYNNKLRLVLDEDDKSQLKSLQQLFPIVDKHISFIEKKNKELATRLKIKFANLPVKVGQDESVDGHMQFPNLYINEVEQVRILIDHFQSKEDKKIDEVIKVIKSSGDLTQKNKIAKMAADDKSRLSKNNRLKLQNALSSLNGFPVSSSWSYSVVKNSLDNQPTFLSSHSKKIEKLWRMSKAKQFFEAQVGKNEDEIHIPRWYHATKHNSYTNFFDLIAASGEIMVMHKGSYKGAWVSNQRESSYGDSVFSFSHRIRKIHPKAKIRTRNNGGVRWRGLQKAIPFIEAQKDIHGKKEEFLSLIGIRKGNDKKDIKDRIIKDLREKKELKNPVIFSVQQIDYIHKNILKSIGCPNLSSRWWGMSKF